MQGHSSSDRTEERRRSSIVSQSITRIRHFTLNSHIKAETLPLWPYQLLLRQSFLPKFSNRKTWNRSQMWSRIGSVRSSRLNLGLGLVKRWLWTKSETGQRFAAVWGNGDYGRLGLRSLDSHWRPAPVLSSAFREQGLRAVACGGAHTLFLTGSIIIYQRWSRSLWNLKCLWSNKGSLIC